MREHCFRWMVPLDAVAVQRNSLRGVRYELDSMTEASFRWRPYHDAAPEALLIPAEELALMSAPSPLIYFNTVEFCYTDRVTRQFGYIQQIPTASPYIGHDSFHGSRKKWHFTIQQLIEMWELRHHGIIAPPTFMSARRPTCVDDYAEWYDRVTRRYMINPRVWVNEDGFQGSQGHLPIAVSFIVFNS